MSEGRPTGYTDPSIMGFSHTHHEYNRFANVLFMPVVGSVKTMPGSRDNPDEGYRSRKDASRERGSAGYYTVFLTDYGVNVELTATRNAGMHRYTFPRSEQSHILIDLSTAASATPVTQAQVEILDNRHVAGWEKRFRLFLRGVQQTVSSVRNLAEPRTARGFEVRSGTSDRSKSRFCDIRRRGDSRQSRDFFRERRGGTQEPRRDSGVISSV
jgi:hypothetical protein